MADFEKVYTIKFKTEHAQRSLKKLDKVLESIDDKKNLGVKATSNLDKLGRSGKRAAKGLEHIPRAATRVNMSLKDIGRNINRYVLLPLGAISVASIKAAFDINKGMANVSTLLDAPIEKIQELKGQVQDLAIESGKGTTDLSDGLYDVISALGESSENMEQLGAASKAAVAGVSETTDAVNMLTAVGKAYNDVSAKSLERTSDLAFQTVKLGVTTFPELAASIGKIAPLAAQFNTSQEEMFATMATLTGVTGGTAEVTTQLASVYSAFMKPSEAMDDALQRINKQNKEYNFESASAMVKTLGFKKSIELLGKEAGGSEEELMAMFRRKEAILAILPLISTQSENYTKKLEEMKDATGATDEAFRKQTEGINKQGHQWQKTKQRMIVFGQRLGDRLLPVLDKLMDYADPLLEWLKDLDKESIDTAISVGKIALQFALVSKALIGLSAGINVLSSLPGVIASIGGGMDTATTKANKFAGALGKLQQGVALIGAAALGYTLGDLIQKGLVEPKQKKQDDLLQRFGNLSSQTEIDASTGKLTLAQLRDREGELESMKARLRKSGLAGRADYTRAMKSSEVAMQKITESSAKKEQQFASGPTGMFSTGLMTGETTDYGLAGTTPWSNTNQGGGGQTTVNMTVNSPNADPKAVAAEVDRKFKQAARGLRMATEAP